MGALDAGDDDVVAPPEAAADDAQALNYRPKLEDTLRHLAVGSDDEDRLARLVGDDGILRD